MKLSNTAIKELSAKYRSILHKYAFLNAVVFGIVLSSQAKSADYYGTSSNGWSTIVGDAIASGFNGTYNTTGGNLVYGGYSNTGDVSNNTVNITGGSASIIYGGYAKQGSATGNTIIAHTMASSMLTGGNVGSYGTQPDQTSTASNNKVILTDTFSLMGDFNIVGAQISNFYLTSNKAASGNVVYLDSQIINTLDPNNQYGLSVTAAQARYANNNTIVIGKNAAFENIKLDLYGSVDNSILGHASAGTGNALEIWTKGITTNTITNFDHYYFILPNTIANGNVVLSVEDEVALDSTTIGVATQSGVNLNEGDKITLIDKTDGGTYSQADMSNVSLQGGSFTTDYIFGLSTEGVNNALIATVTGKNTNDEIKAPVEGQVSSIALLNAGSDLIANAGLENAIMATKESHGNLATFAAISGGYSKYKTGSHINLASASLLTGFAKNFVDKATAGIFVEAGYGDYSTHNNFSKGKVKGDGDSKYYGLGFIGCYDLTKNLYAEASVHGGYLNNDWKSNDTKTPVDYDTDSLYYGAHLGLGYEAALNKTFGWGVYGKYFYTHQEGDDATIDGIKFDFKDVNSHITRLGTRLYYTVSDNFKPFMGVAWDHEYDGKAKSCAGDVAVDAPSLKGDTGMLEFGLKANNLEQSAWDVDASLQGFIGQREGVQGLVKAKYNF